MHPVSGIITVFVSLQVDSAGLKAALVILTLLPVAVAVVCVPWRWLIQLEFAVAELIWRQG